MKSLQGRARRRLSGQVADDGGFSLVELCVGLLLTSAVMSVIPSLFDTVTTASTTAQGTTIGSEQADLAIQNLDRQVASASQVCISGPSNAPLSVTTSETVPVGWALRIEQVEPSGVPQWEQWVVDSTTGVMSEESFTPGGAGNGWVTVARTVYNTSASSPPFQTPTASPGSPQEVLIDLQVSEKPGRLNDKLEIKSAVSAFSTPYSAALPTECAASTTAPTS